MNRVEFLKRIERICTWRRGGRRAPHKPLLLLLALGRVHQGAARLEPYGEYTEPAMSKLLDRFGPPRSGHPEDPFWRLQNDKLWEIPGWDEIPKTADGQRPRIPALREAKGGFPARVHDLLCADSALAIEAAHRILHAHFGRALHAEILDAVGLPGYLVLGGARTLARVAEKAVGGMDPSVHLEWLRWRRDRGFRERVLQAYQRRCAVCGYDVRLRDGLLGLDAAHIKWPGAGGPDNVSNGLALCALHRVALDRGALGLERTDAGDTAVRISRDVDRRSTGVAQLLDYRGEPLRRPQDSGQVPDEEFVKWHWEEVFRGPAWERYGGRPRVAR